MPPAPEPSIASARCRAADRRFHGSEEENGPRAAPKRKLINTGANKLFVRRNARGTSFKEVEDVGRSLAQDRRRKAKTTAKRGQGDRGDRRRSR